MRAFSFGQTPSEKDNMINVRPTTQHDISALQNILDATELFPSDMLPEMISHFLSGNDTSSHWFTAEADGVAIGFCYAQQEMLAEGTWNMLAIAVDPTHQGLGCGAAIVTHLEERLSADQQRVLIADTSGNDAFMRTRAFYAKNGYTKEACIREYWGPGDDKVTFWKRLS